MEDLLLKYLRSGDAADLPSREYLGAVARKYPWFRLPARLLSDYDSLSANINVGEGGDNLIDVFLNKGGFRITVKDSTPERIEGADVQERGYDSEMVSEELAEIYLAQGLREQAADIYTKLCLVYPEKSVYFAELIARIKEN